MTDTLRTASAGLAGARRHRGSSPSSLTACTGSSKGGANDDPNADDHDHLLARLERPQRGEGDPGRPSTRSRRRTPTSTSRPSATSPTTRSTRPCGPVAPNAPDVVSSFTTDNVGEFCTSARRSSTWRRSSTKAGIDPETTFPAPLLDYTQYDGNHCTLPLLSDAYGLYYNKDMFDAAGHHGTAEDAVGVRRRRDQAHQDQRRLLLPARLHAATTTATSRRSRTTRRCGRRRTSTTDGKSNVANDPALKESFEWQKSLVDKLGGYDKLEKYRTTFGDEFGAKNPFMTGQVAMALDGEWRAGIIDDANSKVNYGVAPFPVPDDQADNYGKGYITGTIVGIASTSEKQNAAWEFVKYLTTDTEAVVNFANAIHNVPSTQRRPRVTGPRPDPSVQTFIEIAQNPDSNTTPSSPNGGAYQLTLQDLGLRLRVGQGDRPSSGPRRRCRPDRHRHRTGRSEPTAVSTGEAARAVEPQSGQPAHGAAPDAAATCCATWRSSRRGCSAPGCSSSTRWSRPSTSPSPTTTGSRRRCGPGSTTGSTCSSDYPFFWPALRNTVWLVVVMVALRVIFGLVARACWSSTVKRGSAAAPHVVLRCPTWRRRWPRRWRSCSCSTRAPARSTSILGKLGLPQPGWFNDPAWSKPALTLLALWGIGDLMVIFMAALLDVPREQYEAAELDGAGAVQRFRYVTLPNISPILLFAVVTGVIADDAVLHRAPGRRASRQRRRSAGPGSRSSPATPTSSTLTLPQLVYNLGFQRFDIGAACVIALVLFVLSMVFAAVLMRRGSGFLGSLMRHDDPRRDRAAGTDSAGDLATREPAGRRSRLEWVAVHICRRRARRCSSCCRSSSSCLDAR